MLDLSRFDARFNNDLTGAPAYPPAMLLKIILYAYSQGIVSSRNIGISAATMSPSLRYQDSKFRRNCVRYGIPAPQ